MLEKNWKTKMIICMVCSIVFIIGSAGCATAFILTGENGGVLAAAAAAMGLISVILLISMMMSVKTENDYLEQLENDLGDYAFVRYNKKTKTAWISKNASSMTGIETGSLFLSEEQYRGFIDELIKSPFDVDENIYMSSIAEKWVQLSSFSTDKFDCMSIRDVSNYVSSRNVIRSLKYYDAATGILSRDAFISQVRASSDNNGNGNTIGLIHLVVSGIENVTSFSGTVAADNIIARIASFIKKYENPHNIFSGRTSSNEFSILVTDTYDEGCRKLADKVYSGLLKMLSELNGTEKNNIRLFCGYACFHGSNNSISSMMSAADFAVYDAESKSSAVPVMFDPVSYSKRAHEFKKIQVFNTLVSNNLIDYHFQPIVNAHTGTIFGYEALMRPQTVDGIKLTPVEVLSIAEQQDMLYEIERITFFNSMKLLSENQDFFSSRKLFINCIPNSMLSDEDFASLYDNYGELFDKVVVEITEGSPVFGNAVSCLNERFRQHKAQVALDDYGTGYSNDSTLLSVKPDYIKIDRSILTDIDKDPQKQHLVANIINFASQHGITTLGEGVETLDELETMISLGVDLIQGFVACRATAILMLDIPLDIKNSIISYNLKYMGHIKKTYEVATEEPVDIVNLALIGYTDLVIKCRRAIITGDPNVDVNISIVTEAEADSLIELHNVSIISPDGPALTLSPGCDVNLELYGENTFSHDGIRVPEGARLFIGGKGDLTINCTRNNSAGIGGGYLQDYGEIVCGGEGCISISNKGDSIVGIGGGLGTDKSAIQLISGKFSLILKGREAVGIGSFSGKTNISANPVKIDITTGGQVALGMGAKSGQATIDSAADITANVSGDNCCCVGTLEKGISEIKINGGNSNIIVRGKSIVGIGSINGNTDIHLNAGNIDVLCEGDNATCVGDAFGSGTVRIQGPHVKAVARASAENPIGIKNGKVYILGGSVCTSDIESMECYAIDGTPLVRLMVNGKKRFNEMIQGQEIAYPYSVEPNGQDIMYIYLPAEYAYLGIGAEAAAE